MVKKLKGNFFLITFYIFYNQSELSVAFDNLNKKLDNFLGRILATSKPKINPNFLILKKHTPFDNFPPQKNH